MLLCLLLLPARVLFPHLPHLVLLVELLVPGSSGVGRLRNATDDFGLESALFHFLFLPLQQVLFDFGQLPVTSGIVFLIDFSQLACYQV